VPGVSAAVVIAAWFGARFGRWREETFGTGLMFDLIAV